MIKRPSHRGFTLTEMLVALGILSIFALAGTRLFHSTMRLSHDTAEEQNSIAAFDSAIASLRADVWTATGIEATADRVTLKGPSGQAIEWSYSGGKLKRTVTGLSSSEWPLSDAVVFSSDETSLVIRIPETKSRRSTEISFASEVPLVQRLIP